jgi:hypothetical protein
MSIYLDMPCLCVFACARHILEHTLPRPPSHPGTLSQIQHDGGLRTRTRASQRFPCRHICTRAYTNYAMYARHEWFAREGHSMSHRDITHAEVTPAHATPPMHPTMSVARSSSRYETDASSVDHATTATHPRTHPHNVLPNVAQQCEAGRVSTTTNDACNMIVTAAAAAVVVVGWAVPSSGVPAGFSITPVVTNLNIPMQLCVTVPTGPQQ